MKSSRSACAVLAPIAPLAAIALLGGCASVDQRPSPFEVDTLTVARVEQAAKQMGTTVIWVNYPTRTPTARTQPATTK